MFSTPAHGHRPAPEDQSKRSERGLSPRPTNSRCCARRWTRSRRSTATATSPTGPARGGKTDELWDELAAAGFLGVNVPEEYGGGRHGDQRAGHRARGTGGPGLSPSPPRRLPRHLRHDHRPVRLRRAEAALVARASPPAELKMAFAITEPDAGSNSHNIATTATRDGDVYRLRGTKYFISFADESESVLVVTRTGVDETTGPGRAVALRRRPRQPRPARRPSSRSRSSPPRTSSRCSSTTSRCRPTGFSAPRVTGCARCSSDSTPSAS